MKKTLLIAATILILALFGGQQFYQSRPVLITGITVGFLAIGLAGLIVYAAAQLRQELPWIPPPLMVLAMAMLLSTLFNGDILPAAAGRLWLYAVAVALAVLSSWLFTADELRRGIYISGLAWPLVWLALTMTGWHNSNITAFWPLLFAVVGLTGGSWLYLAVQLAAVLWLGSRGAIVAALVGCWLMIYAPQARDWQQLRLWPRLAFGLVPIGAVALILAAYRSNTAGYRLLYWEDAIAVFARKLIFGVGPGGIKARMIIPEPGGGYQVHAHNSIISWATETGLVGIVALAVAVVLALRLRLQAARWQWALFAGLLAWSMVDEPLYWPGPLWAVAIIIGTLQYGSDHDEEDYI